MAERETDEVRRRVDEMVTPRPDDNAYMVLICRHMAARRDRLDRIVRGHDEAALRVLEAEVLVEIAMALEGTEAGAATTRDTEDDRG